MSFYFCFILNFFGTWLHDCNLGLNDNQELLALEESIGNVCTGLKEDMISRCLKGHTYVQKDDCNQEDSEMKCSICQVNLQSLNNPSIW